MDNWHKEEEGPLIGLVSPLTKDTPENQWLPILPYKEIDLPPKGGVAQLRLTEVR